MGKNSNLNNAKAAKNDEFYTQLDDISNELVYYRPHFEGKKVLCNCNDALHTGFAKFFSLQFEILGLKELICTSFAMNEGEHGVVYRYKGDKNGNNVPDIDEWEQTPMHGNGGFNTPEGLALIDEADIVVTNPPFSLFREFIGTLMEYNKKFLIIGNMNAINDKIVFPLIKENKIWLGCNNGDMGFKVPDDSEPRDTRYWEDEDGQKWRSLGNACWFTNLDHNKRHEELILYKKYNEAEYPKYDGYDAIEVNKVADIPMDYEGTMGVPVTFMNKYCPDQFEVLGCSAYSDTKYYGNPPLYVNGNKKYARILIRFKK